MSDMGDDMPPMGSDAGDDDFDMPAASSQDLPEGVTKEIITTAAPDAWQKPKAGDDVKVHYVGTLEDGTQFDSSRDRGTPFEFCLGKGSVIKGWDLGVATMKKGEVAKFTLAPEFAYGDAGSPPKIPEKATLIFEIELISWVSKDDLFGDEGAVKTEVTAGTGWKKPKSGDEVRCTVRAKAPDGSVVEEHSEVDYVLSSGTFGPLSKVVDKALQVMKKGEEVSIRCTKEYLYGDSRPETAEGGIVELKLVELFEIKDCSFSKDKSVMKKQVKEGDGWETPKVSSKVKLSVKEALAVTVDNVQSPVPGFEPKTLEFTVGEGEVCDLFECGVLEMKKGEEAVLTSVKPEVCAEAQLGISTLACHRIVFKVELLEFDKGKDTWSLSEEEKLQLGTAGKEAGTSLFKRGRTELALERYKKVSELLNNVDSFKEEQKKAAKELKKLCELNKAACHLKLKRFDEVKKACDVILKDESCNVKALFRKAQAELELKEFSSSLALLRKVLEIDPQNREARVMLKQAQQGQKEEDRNVKGLYAKMCKGLAAKAKTEETETEPEPSGNGDVVMGTEDSAEIKPSDVAVAGA